MGNPNLRFWKMFHVYTLGFFSFSFFLSAEIIEIDRFQDLESYISSNSFVVFDLDNTLFIPQQTLGSDIWFRYQCEQKAGKNKVLSKKDFLSILHLWEALQCCTRVDWVEKETASVMTRIQQKAVSMMGLTVRGVSVLEATIAQLQSLGFDFSKTAPSSTDHYFFNEPQFILFRKGILFTAGTDKGSALIQFLDREKLNPQHVVFIDDQYRHLESVEKVLRQRNIAFVGLRYSFLDQKNKNFSQELADTEQHYSSFDHILSDDEAETLIHLNELQN